MSTTINSYSVSLGLNAQDYIRNSSLSRSETSSLTRQINQARSPTENYERSIKALDKALAAGAIEQGTYNRLVKAQGDALQKATVKTDSLASSAKRLFVAYVGLRGLSSTVGSGIQLAADAEDAQIQFKVLLKSADQADKLLSQISDFSASTPFQQREIRDAGKMLLAFKFSSDQVIGTLGMLGNISAATGSRIEELAELVGKAKIQNTIYSEDLNQLTGRGINVLDGLADRFGVATDAVKNLASEGKIHFSDLEAVLTDLANHDFAGLMEERSRSLNGQVSTLKDNYSELKKELATGLLPTINGITEASLDMVKAMRGLGMPKFETPEFKPSIGLLPERQKEPAGSIGDYSMRRGGVMLPSLADSASARLSKSLGDSLTNGIDSIKTGAGGLMDGWRTFQEVGSALAMAGVANTEEITKAVASPAIAAMEAQSQEAYQFLTAATKEKDDRERAKEEREKQIEKNADAWRKKSTEWQGKVLTVLESNGFKRLR